MSIILFYSCTPPPHYDDIFLQKHSGLVTQLDQRSSLKSTATQGISLEDSISSTTSNNIHDKSYITYPPVTVNVSNDTKTATVAPAYAVVTKRTDANVIPTAVGQRVVYSTVTGDRNKVSFNLFYYYYYHYY